MVHIIPTILVKTFKEFKSTVKKIENDFEIAQIDVMDGKFVPNTTFADWHKISSVQTSLKYELHLMVGKPVQYIRKLQVTSYKLQVKKILFHYESKGDISEAIKAIRKIGLQAGLVLNPETEVKKIIKFLPILDCVMLMGVHPGFAGQEFIPHTVEKVKQLRKMNKKIDIEIDGGVSDKNAKALVVAGANILAVHSFLYQGDIKKQKDILIQSIKGK